MSERDIGRWVLALDWFAIGFDVMGGIATPFPLCLIPFGMAGCVAGVMWFVFYRKGSSHEQ